MSDKGTPDAGRVITGAFGESPTAEVVGYRFCRHPRYTLDTEERAVLCRDCKEVLDPFNILVQFAEGERRALSYKKSLEETRGELDELRAEEKRIKARTRNASRKDAEKAVADERKRVAKNFDRAHWALDSIIAIAEKVQRNLPGASLPSDDQVATRRPKRECQLWTMDAGGNVVPADKNFKPLPSPDDDGKGA